MHNKNEILFVTNNTKAFWGWVKRLNIEIIKKNYNHLCLKVTQHLTYHENYFGVELRLFVQ